MKKVKKFLEVLISSVYPNKCIACGELIDEGEYLCCICNKNIEKINLDNFCFCCGHEMDECVCKYNIYRFAGVTCAFKNKGVARKGYYSYKFSKKQHYVKYFSDELSFVIDKSFSVKDIDIICAVPAYKKSGYDHAGYIAKEVSKKLQIPVATELLSCVKRSKRQHKSTIQERLINIDGKYKCNYRVDDLNVLLIDDIKTTGATLDECAKTLMFAGANNVYCAVVLGTGENKKIEK